MSHDTSRLLAGRVALVTGASRGNGAAIARALGRHGAAVGVNYLNNAEAAEKVVADIEAAGSRAVAVAGDATGAEGVAKVVARVAAEFGDVDLLVPTVFGPTVDVVERFRQGLTLILNNGDDIQRRVATQLSAVLHATREVVPGMRRKGGGSIVLISATQSRGRPTRGTAEAAVAKAALDTLAKAMAGELGEYGIRVNTVAPGMVPTDSNAGPHQAALIEQMTQTTPLGRVATVEDVADAVVVLSSPLTAHVTGAYVGVDGGRGML